MPEQLRMERPTDTQQQLSCEGQTEQGVLDVPCVPATATSQRIARLASLLRHHSTTTAEEAPLPEERGAHDHAVAATTRLAITTDADVADRPPELAAPMCFRISAVPQGWLEDDLLETLQTIDPSLDNEIDLSLFPACCGSTQTALLNLYAYSHYFSNIDASKPKFERVPTTAARAGTLLVIDRHFYDLTPLNAPGGDILADIVAVTGLAGHAFGSWRSRETHQMWLKDFLPHHITKVRIMTYGYDSRLAGPQQSSMKMVDFRSHFVQQLKNCRKGAEDRPIIFIGHNLGGILILQALVDSSLMDRQKSILNATKGIIFFGTPHQGLQIEELEAMIEDGSDPDRQRSRFLAQLQEGSDFLVSQREILAPIWRTFEQSIISFYETMKAPTVKSESDKWARDGDLAMMVQGSSARLFLPSEHRLPIHKNNLEMVRFDSEVDTTYQSVVFHIRSCISELRDLPMVNGRWKK